MANVSSLSHQSSNSLNHPRSIHSLHSPPSQKKMAISSPRHQNDEPALPQPTDQAISTIEEQPTSSSKVKVDALTINGKETAEKLVDETAIIRTAPSLGIDFTRVGKRPRRASTQLVSVDHVRNHQHDILSDSSANNLIQAQCCGGGCCQLEAPDLEELRAMMMQATLKLPLVPANAAFKSLRLKLSPLSSRDRLTGITEMPLQSRYISPITDKSINHISTVDTHPPEFVKPHPPYEVFSARLSGARELTKSGAEKRTYHYDLDVTSYPDEIDNVDFRVGGAIGVVAPNSSETVDEIFDILEVNQNARDEPVMLRTTGGRWPTIWGDEEARTLVTTRRELLTWTVDVQSYQPTKQQLRVLAEYATDENEKTILLYLCSKQGQAAFCELRTGPYITLLQLLHAFTSSKPPFDVLLSTLEQLMPRFYSLSSDPQLSSDPHTGKEDQRRTIEIAVTVQEHDESWRNRKRTGIGSGFFERKAKEFIESEKAGIKPEIRIPMFRGLMANPLAREFKADGPMLLIGAGVGIAPFRGFVQRRLRNANCANKVWVLQGIRDSLLDELYSGEWGIHESDIRKVVESRRGAGKYVQEEVRAQADLVWFIINSIDGRIFVCGSSKGMAEGVEEALVDVAMKKGGLRKEEAIEFWKKKQEGMQYISEAW